MGIMITYHGYNNPVNNAHKNVGAHYTRQKYSIMKNKKLSWRLQNFLMTSIVYWLERYMHVDVPKPLPYHI